MTEGIFCDYLNRLDDLKSGQPISYGKALLTSDEKYNLWNKKNNIFNIDKIIYLYELFKYNLKVLLKDFPYHWVNPNELLYTTKGKIWDWTSEEEYELVKESILNYGVYFPIFVLPKGLLHNQICSLEQMKELEKLNLYNSYNGNHRIDVLQHLYNEQKLYDKVLIIEIPPYCEKSCTGFKYTPIDYRTGNRLTKYKLQQPVELYHLSYLEDEMKMYYVNHTDEIQPGVVKLLVDDYNTAFRILTEFQNALEPPLTKYYELYHRLPDGLNCDCFNQEEAWNDFIN